MASEARLSRTAGLPRLRTRVRVDWPAAAWASIGIGTLFIAVSCWWLSQNRGIPVYDSGTHLSFAIGAFEALRSGHLLRAFTGSTPYPPLVHLVGAVGIFIGGVAVSPPIVAENLLFVPLLVLGCYQVGRLAFGPLVGLLAVAFALGSPFVIEEFHEFMLDAPEAAMIAVSLWAILASDCFSRPGVSALAGVAVGLGMLSRPLLSPPRAPLPPASHRLACLPPTSNGISGASSTGSSSCRSPHSSWWVRSGRPSG